MARLEDIVSYCDQRLDSGAFDDYCPNGLQVEGRAEVATIASGVTASQALIEAAAEAGADLLLVHHGYFWRGEAMPLTGMKGRRVRALFAAGLSLLAYHLPLDAHPELGNNACLAARLGLTDRGTIREGMRADVTVFDPDTLLDKATFEDPHQYPTGIHWVIVNGQVAVENGTNHNPGAGHVLRGP